MNRQSLRPRSRQRGIALITALLLLVVVTILGVGMFRSFGLQEQIAGNTREKQRSVSAAGSALSYAEWWLSANSGINATSGVACAGGPISANAGNGQVCSNILNTALDSKDVAIVPWKVGGSEPVVTWSPDGLTVGTSALNVYYQSPRFYISFLSGAYDAVSGAVTNNYQIDALAYGGTPSAVAIVESSYTVSKLYTTRDSTTKFINLGGP
jgi:type IV pilus assembly protein PilX